MRSERGLWVKVRFLVQNMFLEVTFLAADLAAQIVVAPTVGGKFLSFERFIDLNL